MAEDVGKGWNARHYAICLQGLDIPLQTVGQLSNAVAAECRAATAGGGFLPPMVPSPEVGSDHIEKGRVAPALVFRNMIRCQVFQAFGFVFLRPSPASAMRPMPSRSIVDGSVTDAV